MEVGNKEFNVRNNTEVVTKSLMQCLGLLKLGEKNRSYAQTTMNHQSSRSHTLFRLSIDVTDLNPSRNSRVASSVLTFVDLAGSEKASVHEPTPPRGNSPFGSRQEPAVINDRIREGQHINQSLFFLTQVISQRASGTEEGHIPYRNSPLTKVLKTSLGGNSRTAIVLCMTPCLQ